MNSGISKKAYPAASLLFTFLVVLTGCTTQLAPKYDEALFRGITDTNVRIMELFALVSGGTESSSCSQREAQYNAAIGSVDALAIQSRARPVPDGSVTMKVNEYLDSRGIGMVTDGVAPSAAALENISRQLSKMKQVDCDSGLTEGVIAVFRNAVVISMDQALTYESFLYR